MVMKNGGTRKKYYILYKVKRTQENTIQDIEYLKEFTTITDIVKEYHLHFNSIKDIINNSFTEDLKTLKDLTIIKEEEIE